MLDRHLRPLIDPPLNRLAAHLARMGVSANHLSLIGAGFGLAAGLAIASGAFGLGLVLIVLSRLADGLDGPVARMTAPTDFGGYLDILCDYVFYLAVPMGFATAAPANLWPALLLVASFVLTAVSFLAYAALAEKRGLSSMVQGRKSFYYMVGLAEGTETIAVFAAFCLWPAAFPWLACAFALLCLATVLGRLLSARAQFI
jgi:phosphatidylglycerophosphate synthase